MTTSHFVATHPDGTASSRSSATRVYTHVVQVLTPKDELVRQARSRVHYAQESLERYTDPVEKAAQLAKGHQTEATWASNSRGAAERLAARQAELERCEQLPAQRGQRGQGGRHLAPQGLGQRHGGAGPAGHQGRAARGGCGRGVGDGMSARPHLEVDQQQRPVRSLRTMHRLPAAEREALAARFLGSVVSASRRDSWDREALGRVVGVGRLRGGTYGGVVILSRGDVRNLLVVPLSTVRSLEVTAQELADRRQADARVEAKAITARLLGQEA